jgi:gliding motility-associated-like protein
MIFSGAVAQSVEKNDISQKIFMENKGQLIDFEQSKKDEYLFYSQSDNLDVYFKRDGLTYVFKKGNSLSWQNAQNELEERDLFESFLKDSTAYYRLDFVFLNSLDDVSVSGEGKSDYYNNFYLSQCPEGVMQVYQYSKIRYTNVYEGVDFVFFMQNGEIKYNIEVNNPYSFYEIALEFKGAENLILKENEIQIHSPVGLIKENLPKSYYVTENNKIGEEIEITYNLENEIVRFTSKDPLNSAFVIDPVISWTTYYDDSFWNGSNANIDVKGNQFVIASYGFNSNFPTLDAGGSSYYQNLNAGSGDYKILKFDTNGVRIWATYFGGSDYENTADIVIDYNDKIILVGQTASSDLPVQTAGGYYDNSYTAGTYAGGSCIARFNSIGVLEWSTHYDYVHYPKVDVDYNNNIYVVGSSEYDNPPVQFLSGAYNQATVSPDAGGGNSDDIFIIKFNASTNRIWATNLGSTSDEFIADLHVGTDNYLNILAYGDNYYGTGIVTVNPGGGAYYDNTLGIGSGGSSTDRYDALLYRFTPSGSLFWGTAFGGSLLDNMQKARITVDNSNNIIIYGETRSIDLPCISPGGGAYYDNTFTTTSSYNPFLARFSSLGVLNWCTYFGNHGLGTGMNMSSYIGVTDNNELIVVATEGGGVPGTFPLVPRTGDYNATLNVYMGVYIAEFSSSLSLDWSTYYAGTTDRNMLGDAQVVTDACGYALYMVSNWQKYNAAATDPPWVKPIPSSYQNTVHSTTGSGSGLITRFSSLPPDATITPAGPFCDNDAPFSLNAVDAGGTWSGNGVNSSGVFDPSAAGSGTHQIIYTISGSCGDADTINIIVNDSYDATITAAGPFCDNDAPVTLSAVDAGGTWSGNGVNATTGVFNPSTAGVGTHTITYSISGTCGDSDTISIVVNNSYDATITPAGPFCDNDAPFSLTTIDPGGTWSGNGVNSSGVFDPSAAGSGTHQIIYTISGSCGDADTINIIVNDSYDATITPAGPFCDNDAPFSLTTVDPGGTWSGNGVNSSGVFNPLSAGSGTHQVIYTISGSCGDADTINIVVNQASDATITPAGPFCISQSTQTLTVVDSGGTWSGTGVNSSGVFDPSSAGIGQHEIIYTIADPCGDADTITIEVVDNYDATITAAGPFCDNESAVQLTAVDGGGSWTGTGVSSSGLFDPSAAGQGSHEIIYAIPDPCGDADTIDIIVNESPSLMLTATDESCTGAADGQILSSVSGGSIPYTYLWSTGAITQNLLDIGEGTYVLTVTDANGCIDEDSVELFDPLIACDSLDPHIVIPNIFSPNADGENDVLYVRGSGVETLLFIVYDRWGEKVFESSSLDNGWDGTYRGRAMDAAVFVYYIKARFINGEEQTLKGNVTLIR